MNNTHESYCSLETAKMLKEAGFDWECNAHFNMNGDFILRGYESDWNATASINPNVEYYSAQTLDVAQRWLREVKEMVISMVYTVEGWKAVILYPKPIPDILFVEYIFTENTYEEALEAGINKCLTILLEEKK